MKPAVDRETTHEAYSGQRPHMKPTVDRETTHEACSAHVTTKLFGTSTCGCNNNMVIQKQIFSRFLSLVLHYRHFATLAC